ncbi:integrase catalytic domain-containing protein [Trichonephila clavipes]|uniref:Integrase catalytic domain-containing protein n=1 Tax=Trichonephila clavipes TaxID=2585209 RepID=A0A8X7BKW4_TRICX|nr:integrase catalytic domain-containing protein [Trichonephila clavipes]
MATGSFMTHNYSSSQSEVPRDLHKMVKSVASLKKLTRFIARRGRPRIIYCDNGTNFRGAFNDLAKLDWHKISRETSTQKIVWKFIPPTAAWWGGWWERLVRIIKELLRRSLGKSILSNEELSTVICDCEFLINSRPLTYISENPQGIDPSYSNNVFNRESLFRYYRY